jgi:hypothetical protein
MPSDNTLWGVLADIFGENWEVASESERNFFVVIARSLFARLRTI